MLKVYILYLIILIVVKKTCIFKVQIPVVFLKHSPIHFCIKHLTRFIHFFLLIEEFTFILLATIQYDLYVHMSVFCFQEKMIIFFQSYHILHINVLSLIQIEFFDEEIFLYQFTKLHHAVILNIELQFNQTVWIQFFIIQPQSTIFNV